MFVWGTLEQQLLAAIVAGSVMKGNPDEELHNEAVGTMTASSDIEYDGVSHATWGTLWSTLSSNLNKKKLSAFFVNRQSGGRLTPPSPHLGTSLNG